MPIYEYRCDSCGFQKEYIQRMSDALLTDCPECKKATFNKMVTAAGFQLKGGGWYVTDFKGGGNAANPVKKTDDKQTNTGTSSETGKTETSKSEASATSTSSAPASPAASTPASSSST
jgi:putative FmdB family regulatory protein